MKSKGKEINTKRSRLFETAKTWGYEIKVAGTYSKKGSQYTFLNTKTQGTYAVYGLSNAVKFFEGVVFQCQQGSR